MCLLVPFDGSDLSRAALVRAAQFERVLDEDIVVVSVIPRNNATYARERGWIESGEAFDYETVVAHLRCEVAALAPEAEFHHINVDRYAPQGTIAARIKRATREHGATIVFIGSENAGRIMSSITVGQSVASDKSYDTFIVSTKSLTEIATLEAALPSDEAIC